jgi:predicted MFS family arabinose efflux permease
LLFWAASLGFSVATVSAGVLAQHGYGLLFWINAAASIVAALIVWQRVPETRSPTSKQSRRALLPVLLRDRLMVTMSLLYIVYFTLFLQTFTTLPLMMTSDGHSPAAYGALLALNGAVVVVAQPLAVRLLAGRDRSSVLAASMLLVGAGVGFGTVVHGSAGYTGSVLIWTLGEIGVAVMFGATFADLAPADLRGRYMGIASTTWSIGAVVGPLTGAVLLDHAGRTALGAACGITGVALFAGYQALGRAIRCRALAPGERFASVRCGPASKRPAYASA